MLKRMTEGVPIAPPTRRTFDLTTFLDSQGTGMAGHVVDYRRDEAVYSQGDPSDTVLYIQHGSVKLSVLSPIGKEAVVGMLGGGEFFGEGVLAGQPVRRETATAMAASRIRIVPKAQMIHLFHQERALSDCFIAHVLARNGRLEGDLVDQLFNGAEKRLARTLFLLARGGKVDGPRRTLPAIPQEVLAEIVGTTRSRVNLFMNKFRKRGFIDYNDGGLTVHPTRLHGVLGDSPASESLAGTTSAFVSHGWMAEPSVDSP
jgi:CRP/FNR family cyclic AMP-dependent transcriptional regulator